VVDIDTKKQGCVQAFLYLLFRVNAKKEWCGAMRVRFVRGKNPPGNVLQDASWLHAYVEDIGVDSLLRRAR
jgi:hypothetical protein